MLNSQHHVQQKYQFQIGDFTSNSALNNNNITTNNNINKNNNETDSTIPSTNNLFNGFTDDDGTTNSNNPMTDQSHDKSIFSYNDLEAALQQLGISSSSPALSPSIYATAVNLINTSSTSGSNTNNNSSSNNTTTINSSHSSLNNSSSRLASISPLSLSPHSSTSTLNLGSSHSGSPTKSNEHYHQSQHPGTYQRLSAFHHGLNLHTQHQPQQQQSHQSSQHSFHQQQQQQHHHQQQQHSPSLGSPSGSRFILGRGSDTNNMHHQQQHHQLQHQQSISSTSSSITSIPSMLSPQQNHQSQQQQQHQHQQQSQIKNYSQQHHHQHHRPHNHQAHMQSSDTNPSSPTFKVCWCFGEFSGNKSNDTNSDAAYHFKILVPAIAAGAIIGKGGETIAALQKDAGARVKMSKSHDFYPGTQERVCLITGSVESIMTVVDFIMEKIREKPDLTTKINEIESKQSQERDKQVKVLVPNSTAGMIIGKAGAYIKQIKEESGSYVQISQKPKDITLQERCITIIGEKDNNKIACKMILSKIVEDPQSGTCLNVSYADISGPVANYNPTGSPYATNQNAISSSTASLNSALGSTVGGTGLLVNGTGINLSLNLTAPNPSPNPNVATQLLDHIKVAMRGAGYAENVTTEVIAALGVLAKYGVLGVGVGLPHTNGAHSAPVSYLGVSALEQSAVNAAAAAGGGVFGTLGQVNLEQYISQQSAAPRQTIDAAAAAAAVQFDHYRHAGTQAATPISLNNNNFGLAAATTGAQTALSAQTLGALSKSPTPGDLGAKDAKNIEIPEGIVGAILGVQPGPNGRSLVEIQHLSGANIQISKKGIFAPGTRNRIVTITGQPNAIATAHYIIDQKINEEETKRARQNQNTITPAIQ